MVSGYGGMESLELAHRNGRRGITLHTLQRNIHVQHTCTCVRGNMKAFFALNKLSQVMPLFALSNHTLTEEANLDEGEMSGGHHKTEPKGPEISVEPGCQ